MLGKLIKHEWKAVGKVLAIVHIALVLMAIIGKIMLSIDVLSEAWVLWRMLLLIYVFSVMAVGIGTHIYLAVRFYKNMYTDEGYLSFTLPVKPWQHIFSKTLVSSIWILIDGVVIIGSIVILVMYKGMGTEFVDALTTIMKELSELGMLGAWQMILTVITAILSLVSMPLTYYFSISVGQLFNTHKMLASVVAYFITINVIQAVGTLSSAVLLIRGDEVAQAASANVLDGMGLYGDMISLGMIEQLVIAVGFWLIINYIMNRRLNLE